MPEVESRDFCRKYLIESAIAKVSKARWQNRAHAHSTKLTTTREMK